MSISNSHTFAVLSEVRKRTRVALSTATVTRIGQEVTDIAADAARQSRVADAVRWAEHATRASWLYQWLTAEPDPDVIVIDLRETIFIGPILGILNRVIDSFVSYWPQARSGTLFERISAHFVERPVQVLSLAALVAVLTNLLVLVGLGSPSSTTVGARLIVLSLALAGTRVTASADELSETRAFELLHALLSPPEPPEANDPEK